MNVLFLDRLGENYVGAPHTFHEFMTKVSEKVNCIRAGEGFPKYKRDESVDETVRRVMPDCDWVIVDRDVLPRVKKPRERRYRVGVFLSDLHGKWTHNLRNPTDFKNHLNALNYDAFFLKYLEIHGCGVNPHLFESGLQGAVHHLPWSVDKNKFTWKRKKIDVVFLGAASKPYPLRQKIFNGLQDVAKDYNVACHTSPKGGTYKRHLSKYSEEPVGERYVNLLNETKIMIFGSSIYRYPVQKYFESPAAACLTLADNPSTADKLGFIDGQTYININEDNWSEKLLYCLENYDTVKPVARKGLKNILKNHTHERRIGEWLRMLDN